MATTPPTPPPGIELTVISLVVSLTVAWGVFGTRISVLEKEVSALSNVDKSHALSIERISRQLRRLEAHQQDDELLLDQVFIHLRRPLPKRRAGA